MNEEITVIGPECFASADGEVVSWRGRNYVPQSEPDVRPGHEDGFILRGVTPPLEEERVDALLGFDVNDFESTVVYAIFNDPDGDDMKALPEAIKPQLLDVPLLEDESLRRVVDHARLMNSDRDKMTAGERSHVIIKQQTILKTPYTKIEY